MTRTIETTIDPARVRLEPTDLYDIWCHALEAGEWEQVREQFYGPEPNQVCAYGVAARVIERAGMTECGRVYWDQTWLPWMHRAAEILGYADIAEANDAGVSFPVIAGALRQARREVG